MFSQRSTGDDCGDNISIILTILVGPRLNVYARWSDIICSFTSLQVVYSTFGNNILYSEGYPTACADRGSHLSSLNVRLGR